MLLKMMSYPLAFVTWPPFATVFNWLSVPEINIGKLVSVPVTCPLLTVIVL